MKGAGAGGAGVVGWRHKEGGLAWGGGVTRGCWRGEGGGGGRVAGSGVKERETKRGVKSLG